MRWYFRHLIVLGVVLLGLVSTAAEAAKVGYYAMCYSEGRPWAVAPISAAGHTPVYLADLSTADLNGLDVLFVSNCSNNYYGTEYLARLPEIDQAVQDGLVLLIHDRKVAGATAILPGGGGIQTVRSAGQNVDVVDDSTSVTHGPGGVIDNVTLDGARNSEHGYLVRGSLPASGHPILSRPDKSQGVVSTYEHGKGNVIYSSVPLDYYAGILPICIRFSTEKQYQACMTIANVYAPNVIDFAAQLASSVPVANAGVDLTIDEGATATLDGSASSGHGSLVYQWTQLSPASPVISLGNSAKPAFTAPAVEMNTVFTMQLVVTDARGNQSAADTVDITVKNLNTTPVADAGDAFNIKPGKTASLDGSHSYDADGDALSYHWQQIDGPVVLLENAESMNPSFAVPNAIGQSLLFELTVNDGQAISTASQVTITIVDNAAPIANAGTDQTRDEGGTVLLNALASADPDADGLLFDWSQVSGPAVTLDNPGSPTPFFTAPRVTAGGEQLVFALTIMDMDPINPKVSVDQVTINVRNINDPPACNLARPSIARLWPPNHRMRPVTIEGVSDTDSVYKDVAIVIGSITMDEPVVGRGSGHSSPDAVIQAMQPSDKALLRAERKEHSNGRVYQVNFSASDGFESCTGMIKVSVPRSRRHHHDCDDDKGRKHGKRAEHKHADHKQCQGQVAIDDGQNYDATVEHKRHRHEIRKMLEKKLKALKAKREEHKKNKKHKKKNRHEDD